MTEPYIPTSDAAFAVWLLNFSTKLTANPTTYGLVTGDATAVATVNTAFQTAQTAASNPATRTGPTIADRNTARANAEAVVRPLAVKVSESLTVSDGNKAALGVTVRSGTRSPVVLPSTVPTLLLRQQHEGVIMIDYRDSDTPTARKKPDSTRAVQLFVTLGTAAERYLGDYTKTPIVVDDLVATKGTPVSFRARYRGTSVAGGKPQFGPYGAAVATVTT